MKTHSTILFKNKLNYNLRNRVAKQAGIIESISLPSPGQVNNAIKNHAR